MHGLDAPRADATTPSRSSTSAAFRGSPATHPGPDVRQPAWARSPHNDGGCAPESSAPKPLPACGSMADPVVAERSRHPRARQCGSTSAVRGGRSLLAAAPLLPASNAFALPHATLATGSVLVGSRQCAPFPSVLQPPMKPDISTLHKPDILTLQRQETNLP